MNSSRISGAGFSASRGFGNSSDRFTELVSDALGTLQGAEVTEYDIDKAKDNIKRLSDPRLQVYAAIRGVELATKNKPNNLNEVLEYFELEKSLDPTNEDQKEYFSEFNDKDADVVYFFDERGAVGINVGEIRNIGSSGYGF